MHTINGRPVLISGTRPRIQVSDSFARVQTPELVAETNAWLASFFGHEELLPDGVVYELLGRTLVMNRATFNRAMVAVALKDCRP